MAQRLLYELHVPKAQVTVFHMLERPRHLIGTGAGSHDAATAARADLSGGFPLRGGFRSDEERDAAMTAASDKDVAWVRPERSKRRSGTAKNLERRVRVNQARAAQQLAADLSSWPRFKMSENEAYPVYSAWPEEPNEVHDVNDVGPEVVEVEDRYDVVPLPPGLQERYAAASKEYHECQRLLGEHWDRWQQHLSNERRRPGK